MRKLISKTIYVLGTFTLLFGIYVSTFYFVRNKIVHPFGTKNKNETHSIRPLYNIAYYPMRKFVANGSSFSQEKIDVYYGALEKPLLTSKKERGYRSVNIDTPDSLVMIGFTGKQSILEEFDNMENGSYVRMVFGVALAKEHDRFINRLISFEVIDLMDDPRIEDEDFSDEEIQKIQAAYFSLKGAAKICAQEFTRNYKKKVLEHCLQAGYAQNIGGGCYHMVSYSVTATVEKHTLEKCSPEK